MFRPPSATRPAGLTGRGPRPIGRLERLLLGSVMSVMALVLERRLVAGPARDRSLVSS